MRLLTGVESINRALNDDIDMARAVEANLRDYVASLEAQLNSVRASFKYVISLIPESLVSKVIKSVIDSESVKVRPAIVSHKQAFDADPTHLR